MAQNIVTEHANFVSLQVCKTRSKIIESSKKSLQSIAILYPTGFIRLNPKPLSGLKSTCRVWEFHIPTGFLRLNPKLLSDLKSPYRACIYGKFVSLQVCETRSKIIEWPKSPYIALLQPVL